MDQAFFGDPFKMQSIRNLKRTGFSVAMGPSAFLSVAAASCCGSGRLGKTLLRRRHSTNIICRILRFRRVPFYILLGKYGRTHTITTMTLSCEPSQPAWRHARRELLGFTLNDVDDDDDDRVLRAKLGKWGKGSGGWAQQQQQGRGNVLKVFFNNKWINKLCCVPQKESMLMVVLCVRVVNVFGESSFAY